MKKKLWVSFLLLFVLARPCLFAQGQAEPQWWVIREEVVRPDRALKYMEGLKEEWAAAAKYQLRFSPINAWSSGDYHYYFFVPIQNYGSLDSLMAAWVKFQEDLKAKMGAEAYKTLMAKFDGALDYRKFNVMIFRPDLSYLPAVSRLKPGEGVFVDSTYNYIKEGKEGEAEAVAKEVSALFKAKNVSTGFEVLQGLIGDENPVYISIVRAKDPADYYGIPYDKELGPDGQKAYAELLDRLRNLTRKLEIKSVWYREDLSYYPPEK